MSTPHPAAGRQLTSSGLMRRAYQGMQEVSCYVDFFTDRPLGESAHGIANTASPKCPQPAFLPFPALTHRAFVTPKHAEESAGSPQKARDDRKCRWNIVSFLQTRQCRQNWREAALQKRLFDDATSFDKGSSILSCIKFF